MVNLRYIEAFYFVAQFKSFSKAAKEMRVATSAVSRQIKLLEDSLKHPLFVRDTKTVLLTAKGNDLFEKTKRYFEKIEFLNEDKISVGILQSVFEGWMGLASGQMKKYVQDHVKNLVVSTPSGLEAALKTGKCDFIVTHQPIHTAHYESFQMHAESYQVVSVHPIDSQAMKESLWIQIAAFEGIPLSFASKNVIEVSSFNAGLQLIFAGVGMGILPAAVSVPKRFYKKRVTGPNCSPMIYLVTRKNGMERPEIARFYHAFKKV